MNFYINNTLANPHLISDLAPRFTYKTIDIENIELAGGDYALNVKLPITDTNKEIFQYINRVETESINWYNKTYTSKIEIDGNTVFEGTLKVKSVDTKSFNCQFIGANIDWSAQLDKSLREIESFERPYWTGARSTTYDPWPEQWPDSIGYRDIWFDNSFPPVNLFETDGLEFCCPLVSYGNFPAPANVREETSAGVWNNVTFTDQTVPTDATYKAGEANGLVFYNTAYDPLNWGSIFICPYLRTTVVNIFKDQGINVAGDFMSKDKYKNIYLPFTSIDQAPWNWGLIHRVNIDWTQLDGSPGPMNVYNAYSFLNSQTNSQVKYTPSYTFQNIYIKLFAANDTLPAQVTIKENYMYKDSYRFNKLADPLNTLAYDNTVDCFVSQIDGTFDVEWNIKDFGGLLAPSQWFKSTSSTPGFYFILVKRGTLLNPSDSVLGKNGNGLIDINDHTILDPQVVYSQFFDTTTGLYDNLEFAPMDVNIKATVDMLAFETLELMFVSIDEDPQPGPSPSNPYQYITLNQTSTSNLTITAIDEDIKLNPAKFLPDVSQRDFLKSILSMYNLFLYHDVASNTVYINEFENYFLPNSSGIDWSEKASLEDKSLVISPGFNFKEIDLKLAHDENDIWQFVDEVKTDATISNNATYSNEVKTIELLHAWTHIKNYMITTENYSDQPNPINPAGTVKSPSIQLKNIPIPTLSNEEVYLATLFELYDGTTDRSYDFLPRLLKYIGCTIYNTPKSLIVEDQFFNYLDMLFIPSSVQEDSIFNPKFTGENSLLTDWEKWLSLVNTSVKVSVNAYLTPRDIATLDIRRPIRIGGQTFILNSIEEFNPVLKTQTKINLYKK